MSLRPLLSEEKIQARIREIGAQITADYPDGTLYLICILKGACFFLADLARAIDRDAFIDFMGIASYGKSEPVPAKYGSRRILISRSKAPTC